MRMSPSRIQYTHAQRIQLHIAIAKSPNITASEWLFMRMATIHGVYSLSFPSLFTGCRRYHLPLYCSMPWPGPNLRTWYFIFLCYFDSIISGPSKGSRCSCAIEIGLLLLSMYEPTTNRVWRPLFKRASDIKPQYYGPLSFDCTIIVCIELNFFLSSILYFILFKDWIQISLFYGPFFYQQKVFFSVDKQNNICIDATENYITSFSHIDLATKQTSRNLGQPNLASGCHLWCC